MQLTAGSPIVQTRLMRKPLNSYTSVIPASHTLAFDLGMHFSSVNSATGVRSAAAPDDGGPVLFPSVGGYC